MSRPFRWVAGLLAGVLLVVGIALLSGAGGFLARWPWPLTPLTSQALSAWFIGIGIVAALSVADGDRIRTRHTWTGALALAVLQSIALLRYGSAVLWSAAAAWAYVALVVVIGVVGIWGLLSLTRVDPAS